MKKIVEVSNSESGLEELLGEKVLLLCANYFYTGKLTALSESEVALEDAAIVYETGAWADKAYKDAQKLGGTAYVRRAAIEAYCRGK